MMQYALLLGTYLLLMLTGSLTVAGETFKCDGNNGGDDNRVFIGGKNSEWPRR